MWLRFILSICTVTAAIPFLCGCQSLNFDRWTKSKTAWGATDKNSEVDPDEILDPLGRRKADRFLMDDLSPSQLAATLISKTTVSKSEAAAESAFDDGKQIYEEALVKRDADPDGTEHLASFNKAAGQFRIAASKLPDSPLEHDALFFQAESFFFANRYVQANRAYETLLVKYNGTEYLDKAEARRFAIAQYWLELSDVESAISLTNPSRPKTGMEAEARRILHRIRLDDPTGKLADDATLALANAYFKNELWLDAGDTYEDLRLNYPGSPHQFHAHLFELKARLNAYRGKSYSADPLIRADKILKTIVTSFPEQIESEREYLANEASLIRHKLAERDWSMAQYYAGQGENRAAQIYYSRLVKEFDDTAFSSPAREEIEKISELPPEPDQPAEWLVKLFPDSEATAKPVIASGFSTNKTR